MINILMVLQMFIGANSILPATSLTISDTLYNPAVFETSENPELHLYLETLYVSEMENEFKFAYDQFNNGVGKINTYSGEFSYTKPSNLLVGLIYKSFSLVGGYEVYKSFEYEKDREVFDQNNMRTTRSFLFSHGGIYGAYLGIGLKSKIFSFGIRFVDYLYRLSLNTSGYYSYGDDTMEYRKPGLQIFSNIDLTDRIRFSLFYANEVSFYFQAEFFAHTCPLPFNTYSTIPERKGVKVVYIPPSDIVTMTSFSYVREGGSRYYQVDFRHDFLNVNILEFGGGIFDGGNDWGSFVALGLGTDHGKVGLKTRIRYSYTLSVDDRCSDIDERLNTLLTVNLGVRYRL